MRDRHNIVGSEVGRPKPPYYVRGDLKLRATPGGGRRPATTAIVGLVLAGAGVVLGLVLLL